MLLLLGLMTPIISQSFLLSYIIFMIDQTYNNSLQKSLHNQKFKVYYQVVIIQLSNQLQELHNYLVSYGNFM